MTNRIAKQSRETNETKISVELNLDGQGDYDIDTGNGMFNHLLEQLSRHGMIDLSVNAKGDTDVGWHHLVEDCAIVIGKALRQAVSDARGITRIAHSFVPLDEALVLSAVDFGGRGYANIDMELTDTDLGGLPAHMVHHFLETLAREGSFNLHVRVISGISNHHKAEAVFKSLARAMRTALTIDIRLKDKSPSTKGSIR